MSTIKDKVSSAAHTVADKAKEAVEFVKEKTGLSCGEGKDLGVSAIKERMDVIASCGKKVGVVDHIEATAIKLTKNDSPDGQHHFVPTAWVDHVDTHVHLKKNSMETTQGWKTDAMSCGCG